MHVSHGRHSNFGKVLKKAPSLHLEVAHLLETFELQSKLLEGVYIASITGFIKGDTRSLDYSSFGKKH